MSVPAGAQGGRCAESCVQRDGRGCERRPSLRGRTEVRNRDIVCLWLLLASSPLSTSISIPPPLARNTTSSLAETDSQQGVKEKRKRKKKVGDNKQHSASDRKHCLLLCYLYCHTASSPGNCICLLHYLPLCVVIVLGVTVCAQNWVTLPLKLPVH